MATNIPVNSDRLWATLMEMAEIGATEKGGNCRLTLTDLDKQGRDLFVKWCGDAGCTITVDAIGNIFARRPGRDESLAPVMMGSHLDTQPTGGRFDGVLGVLAGLEVVRTLNDHGVETAAPIEVACWTNEEGSRFSPAMMGSGVFAGQYGIDEIKASTDIDGLVLGDELERIGYAGAAPVGGRELGAYFELHIEQGPILEAEEKTIGVVTAAQGQRWYEINLTGQESHAGPTPMPRRRDALVAAAKVVQEVNRIGHAFAPNACATVGHMQVSPNSRNVIPGSVFLTVDFRHPDDETLLAMDGALKAFCAQLPETDKVAAEVIDFMYFPPVPFEAGCVEAVRAGAKAAGYDHMDIISGAGHDAVYVAEVAPTGMIFVPCEDGISHNEIENATPEDCAAGCQVLLHAVLDRAEQPG
ncbi:MAG: Zn-dependent hydrolase [Magnetovibrio sp.]|nr:Zn-dependent hydrolase [Magnetovibrio sp.]